jgi:diaminopimelate epimerase
MRVTKGHGTGNDFVVWPDLSGATELSTALVRAICDRHTGIGADGVLRLVASDNDPDGKPMAADAPYFMDYRNADGSIAEMCGNGVRVLVRYLQQAGLAGAETPVATRAGVRHVHGAPDGPLTVQMGAPELPPGRPTVAVPPLPAVETLGWVRMPNPHVVVALADPDQLAALDLSNAPRVEPTDPEGQNVEFVVRAGSRRLAMRVHERGVGETRSCGTGICAAAVAVAARDGIGPDGTPWQVDVPGGSCSVEWRADGEVLLTGPAVLVGEIELDDAWLAAANRAGAGGP